VIELKNVRAGQNTFGQIATYLGWVQQRLSNGKPADGLVIARGFDNRFLAAAATNDRISHLDLQELGFE
jgi:restriction system protein